MLQCRKKLLTEEKQERRKTGGGIAKVTTDLSPIDILLEKNTNIELELVPDSDSLDIHSISPQLFGSENNDVTRTTVIIGICILHLVDYHLAINTY